MVAERGREEMAEKRRGRRLRKRRRKRRTGQEARLIIPVSQSEITSQLLCSNTGYLTYWYDTKRNREQRDYFKAIYLPYILVSLLI